MSSVVHRPDGRHVGPSLAALWRGLALAAVLLQGVLVEGRAASAPPVTLRLLESESRSISTAGRARLAERGLDRGVQLGQIDTAQLDVLSSAEQFAVESGDGRRFVFTRERVELPPSGGVVWVGALRGDGDGAEEQPHSLSREHRAHRAYRAHLSVQGRQFVGTLELPETALELLPGDGQTPGAVLVTDLAAAGASRAVYLTVDALPPPPLSQRPAWMQAEAMATRAAIARAGDALKAAPSPQSTIDVLIAYTAGMVTRYGSTAGVVARLNNLVAYANTAYATSEVAITLRLVHSVEVSYPNDGANDTALYSLTGHNGSTSVTVPASLSAIAGLRNTYGADLVALIRPYARGSHGSCGVGWVGGYNVSDIGDDAPFGHSVTSDGSDVGGSGFFCPLGTFAHELGHNMGLMHDRARAGGALGATPYAYGYIIPDTSNGDVMSYASGRIQAFSSPALRCTGTTCAMGASGSALGVPADGPGEACLNSAAGCSAAQASPCTTNPSTCADASRALNFTRVKVAAYRTAASSTVSISGTARFSDGTSVPDGTPLCASPAASVSCTSTNNGAYSCTVPSGWTGTLHLQAGNSRRVAARRFTSGITTATSGQDFTVVENTAFACNLDIDNNGLLEGAIDGAMVVRRMMGLAPNEAVVARNGVCAQRTAAADKANFLAGQNYDFDGGGALAAREGLVLLRLMLGVAGTQAVVGTGYAWSTVQGQINAACGTAF